ncbi:MAG: sugar phosphate isomerase/epimerase [Ruminococcaceae bacterium]|nr:sugar phosphate isomerase/epimerase [Oscillospiraceae bacterium]
MIIGAQLYTVRDYTKNLPAFEETLNRIADIGYKTVQVSGTCEFPAEWLASTLQKVGLQCVLTHVKPRLLMDDAASVCREHLLFGCKNIGLGSAGVKNFDEDSYTDFVNRFLPVAKRLNENGGLLFFHNHASEFVRSTNGKTYLERMTEDFAPELLHFTLDTYWAQFAGANPKDWLKRLAGRVECVHLKDLALTPEDWRHRMAPVGSGNMDFEGIIQVADDCGAEFLLVEQDDCYGEDPFLCLKKSYDYLKSLGLN